MPMNVEYEPWSVNATSVEATQRLAAELASVIEVPLAIGLSGTLGAGKTCFTQALATSLGVDEADVTSPTYTLWQTYAIDPTLHHLDAYRIRSEDEFWDLGIEEAFEERAIVLIEWAEKFPDVLPDDALWIRIEAKDETVREFIVRATGPVSQRNLAAWRSAWGEQ